MGLLLGTHLMEMRLILQEMAWPHSSHGKWQPIIMEKNRSMAMDPTGNLSLLFSLERFRIGLPEWTNQWPDSLLQLLNPVIRIV
jgi:hypothetical protein